MTYLPAGRIARRAAARLGAGAASALLLMALAGCALSGPNATPSATPTDDPTAPRTQPTLLQPLAPATDETVTTYCPLVDAVHYSSLTEAQRESIANIFVCGVSTGTATDDFTSREVVLRVTGGDDDLLAAYDVPSAAANPDVICLYDDPDPKIVWLSLTDGTTVPIYAPVDDCGQPTADATDAVSAIDVEPWVVVTFRGSERVVDYYDGSVQ